MSARDSKSTAGGPRVLEGSVVVPAGARFALVASRFNSFIVEHLVEAALDAIVRHGGDAANVTVVRVPGAWEMPLVAQRVARASKPAARSTRSSRSRAVIRGGDPALRLRRGRGSKGVATASMATGVPIAFGVLTTDSIEQAIERAGTKAGNKGWDAAVTAIEMVSLARALGDAGF